MMDRFNFRAWITQNPVILKEMRIRMRGNRAFLILTLYLIFLGSILGIVYLGFVTSSNTGVSLDLRQTLGKSIFGTVVSFQLFTVSFIAPALTAGSISSERENQTFDLLRTTLLPARSLVIGKLNSALSYILLLIFATLPLTSIAFLFGGVTMTELFISAVMLIVTALAFCSIGVFFSSFTNRTLVSTVLAYAFAIMLIFGLPLFIFMFAGFFSATMVGVSNNLSDVMIILLGVVVYFMIAINPFAAAVVTEVILVEEGSAFLVNLPTNLTFPATVPIISPWITFTAIYLIISLILVFLSTWFVKRTGK